MIVSPQVPVHRLVLSLSEALDHVHPEVTDHQQRVAYISINMARHMGLRVPEVVDLFQAAALHDIGLISIDNKIAAVRLKDFEQARSHQEAGYWLLKDNPVLAAAAEIVRYHHIPWADGRGAERDGHAVPLATHIIALADSVERMINRNVPVLQQSRSIIDEVVSLSGKRFHPDCVEAFRQAARAEAFWLDIVCDRVYGALLRQVDWPVVTFDEVTVAPIAELFARIVDAASPWTMVHSAGVTATAVALAERLKLSPREVHLMRAAGYLHDLGKLTVPASILDKPGRLTDEEMLVMKAHTYHTFRILDTIGGMPQISEWAAFHHERLDGNGYPFHHTGNDLTLGSRIMAVADVFTAVTEDRPYREGMSSAQAMSVLDSLAANGGLDGDIVATVRRDYDGIDAARRQEQAEYGRKQQELARWLRADARSAQAVSV